MQTPHWMTQMFDALDAGNVDGFCSFLSDDCEFIFASLAPVEGKEATHQFVDGFLGSIQKTDHAIAEVYSTPGRSVVRGEVTYTRKDESILNVPFVNVFEHDGQKVDVYQIYVDNSAL